MRYIIFTSQTEVSVGLGDHRRVLVDHAERKGYALQSVDSHFISSRVSDIDDLRGKRFLSIRIHFQCFYHKITFTRSSQSRPKRDLRMCKQESPLSHPMGGMFSNLLDTVRISKPCLM